MTWDDLVEAMTTLEAGTAVGVEYIPEESRAVAIHEAGHAAAGHVYLKGAESTRLSIRMRGGALGHHQALEKEERFSRFRCEEFARLVWALGAMAAERVFYGENSNGVGGDVHERDRAGRVHGRRLGDGPEPFAITPREDETEEEARERILKRFEKIGLQIVNRTGGGGPFAENPIASVLGDPDKRAIVGQLVGQAYVAAYNLIVANREAVEHIADVLAARRELFGDELLEPARRVEAHDPRGRPVRGELVADDVMDKAAPTRSRRRRGRGRGRRGPSRAPTARGASPIAAASRRSTSCSRSSPGRASGAARPRRPREPAPAPAWSAWEPTGSVERAQARRSPTTRERPVPPAERERRSSRSPYAGPPTVTGPDGSTFQAVRALRWSPTRPAAARRRRHQRRSTRLDAVMYTLCGLGRRARSPRESRRTRGSSYGARRSSSRSTRSSTSTGSTRRARASAAPRADGHAGRGLLPSAATSSASSTGRSRPDADRAPHARRRRDPADEQRVIDRLTVPRVYSTARSRRRTGRWSWCSRSIVSQVDADLARRSRAKARLDTLDYYPEPVDLSRVRIRVAPWFFRIPGFRRYQRLRALADDPVRRADASGRPRHPRALPHLAGAAPRPGTRPGST